MTDAQEVRAPGVRRAQRALLLVLLLALLVAAAGLVLPRALADDGDEKSRQELVTAANDFAAAYNTYDVADLADYQDRMAGLLTTGYKKQFDQVTTAIFGALRDKKQRSADPKVLGVAIDSFDTDSAEALVAVDASISNTDTKTAVRRHFRWKVAFQRQGGRWKVDDFESVAALAAETATPTPAPEEGR